MHKKTFLCEKFYSLDMKLFFYNMAFGQSQKNPTGKKDLKQLFKKNFKSILKSIDKNSEALV